jgi:hypothetical protein
VFPYGYLPFVYSILEFDISGYLTIPGIVSLTITFLLGIVSLIFTQG